MKAETKSRFSVAVARARSTARRCSGCTSIRPTVSSMPLPTKHPNLPARHRRPSHSWIDGSTSWWSLPDKAALSGGALRLHSQRDCLALAWLGVARLRECGGAVQELLRSESAFDRLLLAPVMIGVALEAAGLGGVEPRPMALPAILNAGQKDVGGRSEERRVGEESRGGGGRED